MPDKIDIKTETKAVAVNYDRISHIVNIAVKEYALANQNILLDVVNQLTALNELVVAIASDSTKTEISSSSNVIELEDWKDAVALLETINTSVDSIKDVL